MKLTGNHVIGGLKFEFTQLSPRRALPIYTFLVALIGETGAKATKGIKDFSAVNGLQDFLDSTNVDLGVVITAFAEGLRDVHKNPDLDVMVDNLLAEVMHNGQSLSLDSIVFQGKMKLLTQVIVHALKVNFSDFFEGSEGIGSVLRKVNDLQDTTLETPA